MTHVLNAEQFTQAELLALFESAQELQNREQQEELLKGRILATVFFEPSTRTRLSFESAMLRLGGQIISIPNLETSSMNKGETIQDTGRMISTFADIIALRTPEKGQVAAFAEHSSVPVINAGDGTGEHPTQHLLDFYTIWKERKGQMDGITLGLMGDCKNSRVLRGMAKMATQWDMKIIFIAPEELQVEKDITDYLEKNGREYSQASSIDEVIDQLDVLDINRIRHEYFADKERALEVGKQFILNAETVKKGRQDLIVLDPLPRVNTVQEDVDELPQAKYFEAVENGIYIRMSLLKRLLT